MATVIVEARELFPSVSSTLGRTALIGASLAAWMLSSDERAERLRRSLSLARDDYVEHIKFGNQALSTLSPDDLHERSDEQMRRIAGRRVLNATLAEDGVAFNTCWPTRRAQILYLLDEFGSPYNINLTNDVIPAAVRLIRNDDLQPQVLLQWRSMSGAVHALMLASLWTTGNIRRDPRRASDRSRLDQRRRRQACSGLLLRIPRRERWLGALRTPVRYSFAHSHDSGSQTSAAVVQPMFGDGFVRGSGPLRLRVMPLSRVHGVADGRHVPFSKRHDPEAARKYREALYSGIPEHLRSSFSTFLEWTIQGVEDLQQIERDLEHPIYDSVHGFISEATGLNKNLGLDVVHERLCRTDRNRSEGFRVQAVDKLAGALIAGGSAYEVVLSPDGTFALSDRVEPSVKAAAEQAMAHGRSGDYLRTAWSDLYGRGSNPGDAYGHAVKAVEAAAAPVVIPEASEPTLGQIVKALRDAPAGKFRVVLTGKNDAADSTNVVRLMAQLLWTHDHARHGTADESKPTTVVKEEAEAAVHLAVVLVQWFESGAISMA